MVPKKILTSKPLVSINLRTLNSAKTIEEALLSVKRQSYKNIETVVSDGYSTDGTLDLLKKYKCRVYFQEKLGDARYNNLIKSRGKYVISLDSDQILDLNLIEKCVRRCEKKGFDALIIPERSFVDKGTYLEKLLGYDKMLIDASGDISSIYGSACPRFFNKKALMKIKWPKRLAVFDDAILYARLSDTNAKVEYMKGVYIKHHEVKEWKILFKKFFKYGQGYITALQARPETVSVHSLPRRAYFTKKALKEPKYFLGLFLLYFIKVMAASFGTIFFLTKKAIGAKT